MRVIFIKTALFLVSFATLNVAQDSSESSVAESSASQVSSTIDDVSAPESTILDVIPAQITSALNDILALESSTEDSSDTAISLIDSISAEITPAINSVSAEITPAINSVSAEITPAINSVSAEITPAINSVSAEITPAINSVSAEITPAINSVSAEVTPTIVANASQVSSIVEALISQGNLSTVLAILSSDAFASLAIKPPFDGNFTIFAPTDDAFEALVELSADNEMLASTLAYHILQATIYSNNITQNPQFVQTTLANPKYVNLPNGSAQVVGVIKQEDQVKVIDGTFIEGYDYPKVIKADIKVGNGVFHIIDKVLTLPQSFSTILNTNPIYSNLTKLLNTTNSLDSLDGLTGATLFAPSNSAFESITSSDNQPTTEKLTAILKGHVIGGIALYSSKIGETKSYPTLNTNGTIEVGLQENGTIKAGDATVIQANILAKNGVVHRVDKVITVEN